MRSRQEIEGQQVPLMPAFLEVLLDIRELLDANTTQIHGAEIGEPKLGDVVTPWMEFSDWFLSEHGFMPEPRERWERDRWYGVQWRAFQYGRTTAQQKK